MNTDTHRFKNKELTGKVIGVFYDVYNELGHSFIESVYQKSLQLALTSVGTKALSKIEIPVQFRRQSVGDFEADMLVENCLSLELKSGSCARLGARSAAAQLSARD